MHRAALVITLLASATLGCSHFGIYEAAQRIAISQQCEVQELTLVGVRGTYEASGCGATAVYRCAGGGM